MISKSQVTPEDDELQHVQDILTGTSPVNQLGSVLCSAAIVWCVCWTVIMCDL